MKKIFNLNEKSIIYVLCPAENKTGGTELLHQLVYQLNKLGKTAYITYFIEGKAHKSNPTPKEFKKYIDNFCFIMDIVDNENNILVLPEICIGKHKKLKKIQKCVWWLSVDNYIKTFGRLNRLKRYGIKSFIKHLILNDYSSECDLYKIKVHLFQSYFAANFLMEKGINKDMIFYLSDYINEIYLKDWDTEEKEDIVLYNPKKGYSFTQKLIAYASDIRWIPIQNMTNDQVLKVMRKAKVYIDFGNHPGKDRIPREAAISGCCIITNKRGAAGFYQDVSIDDKYKFEDKDEQIPLIIDTLRFCLRNYNSVIIDFSNYRTIIKNEKAHFLNDVYRIFS